MKYNKIFLTILFSIPLLANCSQSKASLKISNKVNILEINHEYQLEVKRENVPTDIPLICTSSKENIASVDDSGKIKTLDIGATTITVASSLDRSISDSFLLEVEESYLKGVVRDEANKPISGVYVSSNGKVAQSNINGEYIVAARHGVPVYFEKDGFLSFQYIPDYNLTNGEHILDVTLKGKEQGRRINIHGMVTEMGHSLIFEEPINLSIRQGKKYLTTSTNASNVFNFKNVLVGENVVIEAYHNKHNFKATTFKVTGDTINVTIDLEPYQEELIFSQGARDMTTGSDKSIVGHVYHKVIKTEMTTEKGVMFDFNANYDAFVKGNTYRICFNAGNVSIPNHTIDSISPDDFDVGFNVDGEDVKLRNHHSEDETKAWGTGNLQVKVENPHHASVFIPYSLPKTINADKTFGIYFDSGTLGKCKIFGHDMSEENQLSYVRINSKNEAYSASVNDKPDDVFKGKDGSYLDWNTSTTGNHWRFAHHENGDTILGQVGNNFNYGYKFKIAERGNYSDDDNTGIYLMAKMAKPEMNGYFLENSLIASVFIDAHISDEHGGYKDKDIDRSINRFAMVSNFEAKRSYPRNSGEPFADQVEHYKDEKIYGSGVRYYSNRDLAILYVPYTAIATSYVEGTGYKYEFSKEKYFGVAPNLNYKATEWHAWKGDNPTGYNSHPHFEERFSYIHFEPSQLSIIKYSSEN